MSFESQKAWASKRTDQIADEILGHRRRDQPDLSLSFDTAKASTNHMLAHALLEEASAIHGGLENIAFLLPEQDLAVLEKSSQYAFKYSARRHIGIYAGRILERDGKRDKAANLYRVALTGSSEEAREHAWRELADLVGYAINEAQVWALDDVRLYSPGNPNSSACFEWAKGVWARGA